MIEHLESHRWVSLAGTFRDYNYQQLPAYAEMLAELRRARAEQVAIRSGDHLLGLANVRIRTVPVVGGGMAYISGGPLTRRDCDDDPIRLAECLKLLKEEYVDRRGLTLRILGPLGSPEWNRQSETVFRDAGMECTGQSRSYRTFLLDIRPSPEDLRAACSKYWRRNLRRAEERDFEVRAGTGNDLFGTISELYDRLRHRKQFHANLDAEFYSSLQTRLTGEETFTASVVEVDGDPVSGLIVSMLGDTCIPLILATDEVGLRSYAAYRLQWHSISMAREHGMSYYDLGGIDPDRNSGVYNFKKGLRGLDLTAPGPFESAPAGVRGLISRTVETAYGCVAARPDRTPPPLEQAA
jgi:hypothetical protein